MRSYSPWMQRVRAAVQALSWIAVLSCIAEQPKRPVEACDCVTVQYLDTSDVHRSIQINAPDTAVAYIVKSPNLITNQNDRLLYVDSLERHGHPPKPRLIAKAIQIAEPQWLANGDQLAVLMANPRQNAVVAIDIATGARRVLARSRSSIEEYAIDSTGNTIVFATKVETSQASVPGEESAARGYRIDFNDPPGMSFPRRRFFVMRRTASLGWSTPEPIIIHSPFTRKIWQTFPYLGSSRLSLSPDGRYLLFTYVTHDLPTRWMKSPYTRRVLDSGGAAVVILLIDLRTGKATVPLDTADVYGVPVWAPDGHSFMVSARSPVNSIWAQQDLYKKLLPTDAVHLFEVNVETNRVQEVLDHLSGYDQPVAWPSNGQVVLETDENNFSQYVRSQNGWVARADVHVALANVLRTAEIASDGRQLIGEYQDPTTPPELFFYSIHGKASVEYLKLNPQFDERTLAPARPFDWGTITGYHAHGLLLLPPDYKKGTRYPLVIQTYASGPNFLCDSGLTHFPSFAPQPLANAGIAYIVRILAPDSRRSDEDAYYPKEYPGSIAEAVFQMDLWDGAVQALNDEGVIDPTRVGIIGFSRSGWYTEFALAHSRTHYRAATVADNVQYSLGEYWLLHAKSVLRAWDAMYGGSPYGVAFENWEKYSISFTAPQINTPLLMEIMGNGASSHLAGEIPLHLALSYELFTEMNQLHRPIELYYYPNEDHAPNHPLARLASLQRNVDWYRFWLQGIEDSDPTKRPQYDSWEKLRLTMQRKTRDYTPE